MPPLWSSLPILLVLPLSVLALTLNCDDAIQVDGHSYQLKPLAGVKTVHSQRIDPPTVHNTTFSIDLCDPLKRDKDRPDEEQCPTGSRVCGQRGVWEHGELMVTDEVIPIAGQYTNEGLDLEPYVERLGGGASHEDTKREGIRITLQGGRYPFEGRNYTKQRAIVELICDLNVTGNEGFEENKSARRFTRRADDDNEDDDSDKLPELDEGKSIAFVSYEEEKEGTKTLRLSWRTKYACDDIADEKPDTPSRKSSGWGFFTWFIIILFLLAAAYIIFGSWLNYNRYGARGWDLVPHGDSIRDLPYTLKDLFSSIMGRLQGSGSRGGYSAV